MRSEQLGRVVTTVLNTALGAVLIATAADFVKNLVAGETTTFPTLLSLATVLTLAVLVWQQAISSRTIIALEQRLRNETDRIAQAISDQELVVATAVETLNRKGGISIAYFPAGTTEQREELHTRAQEIVQQAPQGSRVRAVNSYVEVFSESNSTEDKLVQRNYLRAFEGNFTKWRSNHRLIQLRHSRESTRDNKVGDFDLANLIAPAYFEHYNAIISFSESHPSSSIKLEEVEPSVPISFVIVETGNEGGGSIIWQIHKHSPRDDGPDLVEMLGVFIIDDPGGHLVGVFKNWFALIDRGSPRAVTRQRLAATDPSDNGSRTP